MRPGSFAAKLGHGKNFNGIVKLKAVTTATWFKPALGAGLTVLCGLLLGRTLVGEAWQNASYDYLFRFSARTFTNPVVLVLMDEESERVLGQGGGPWNRAIHAQFLNKLADDGARLVVFDVFFDSQKNPETDAALAAAMRRCGNVVLAADVLKPNERRVDQVEVEPIPKLFLDAAVGHGVGAADPEPGGIARRQYPFGTRGDGPFRSLGWAAAAASGKTPDPAIEERWLRYYGEDGGWRRGWEPIPYCQATNADAGFFRDKIVFIGRWPERSNPASGSGDMFRTPYTRWNGPVIGGVQIHITTFLNLVNEDWLERSAPWVETILLVVSGIFLGGGLCRFRPLTAALLAAAVALVTMLGFASWSYYTNGWFPWLVIAGGQVPCALAWTWLAPKRHSQNDWADGVERFPGYTTLGEPFGEGAYGKVWLVRNATGQLQALKEIERAKFEDEDPYDREFRGIKNYKPFSNQHPGLLHIDHVNRNDRAGYFYYVMELGDPLDPEWEQKGELYQPRDLSSVCGQADLRRLSAHETIRIGIALVEALDYLHGQELVHRDIKPSNIVFVGGRPKFADVGLVRGAPTGGEALTQVYTEHYRAPDGVGTKSADIYALGMTLYVISTGKHPRSFSELSTTLVAKPEFMRLNEIICQACQPVASQRYASAAEMLRALRAAQQELDDDHTRQI